MENAVKLGYHLKLLDGFVKHLYQTIATIYTVASKKVEAVDTLRVSLNLIEKKERERVKAILEIFKISEKLCNAIIFRILLISLVLTTIQAIVFFFSYFQLDRGSNTTITCFFVKQIQSTCVCHFLCIKLCTKAQNMIRMWIWLFKLYLLYFVNFVAETRCKFAEQLSLFVIESTF